MDKKMLARIEKIASIKMKDEETELRFIKDVEGTINSVRKLLVVDLKNVKAFDGFSPYKLSTSTDDVEQTPDPDVILKNSFGNDKNMFKVPKIIKDSH